MPISGDVRGALATLVLMGCVPTAAAYSSSPAHAGETVLQFQRVIHTIQRPPSQPGTARVDSARTLLTVILGDRTLMVYEEDRIWVYDFGRRRLLSVDREDQTYSDWSLYAQVAFNEMALASRLATLERNATPGRTPSVLDLETLFSMRAPPGTPRPRESLVDSSRGSLGRVLINGAVAMSSTPSDTSLPAARSDMFERFLIYRCQLHPDARRALVETDRLPRTLFYRYRDGGEETTVSLTLQDVLEAPEASDPTAACRRVDIPDPTHAALSARLQETERRCSAAKLEAWAEEVRAFEDRALASGHYLEAALASVERSAATCESLSAAAWPAEVVERAQQDERLRAYRASLEWRTAQEADEALQRLAHLDRSDLEKGYVLELGMASARQALGDVAGGAALLLGVLSRNPCLAGAWLDLANGYLQSYETALAWACLETARRVAPADCPALDAAQQFERGLAARHPEYFE